MHAINAQKLIIIIVKYAKHCIHSMTVYRESTRSAYGQPGMLVIIFATVPVVVLTATATEQTSITEYDRLKYKLNLTIALIAIVTFSLSFSLSYSVMLYFKLNVTVIYHDVFIFF